MKKSSEPRISYLIPDLHAQAVMSRKGNLKPFSKNSSCHDPAALSIVLQVIRDNPSEWIVGQIGDLFEMDFMGKWHDDIGRRGLTPGSDGDWYTPDYDCLMNMGRALWEYLRKICPDAKFHQVEGNHDWRNENLFNHQSVHFLRLSRQVEEMRFRGWKLWKDLDIDFHPFSILDDDDQSKSFDIGKVRCLHGYKGGVKRALHQHDNSMIGDMHQVVRVSHDDNSREKRVAWCTGCLCNLSPAWATKGDEQTKWRHGFGVVEEYSNGDQLFYTVEINNYRCIFARKEYRPVSLASLDKSLAIFEI